jgi:ribonuclease D
MLNPHPRPPIWVDTPVALESLAIDLNQQSRIAVDTESNSLHAYRERLCLVQFSTEDADYLVDTLVLDDLVPLESAFATPKIEKIFHAVEYDVLCLHRDFGIVCNNVFDTMVAARTLGYPAVGLGSLLAAKFGVAVNKRFQKADWARRPLPRDMLDYARLDTHYLIPLRDMLANELIEKELTAFATEDFARLGTVQHNNHRANRPAWERISGVQKLSESQIAILDQLCQWREKTAERLDRPPFKVMSDDRLLALATNAPSNRAGLAEAGLTNLQVERFGAGVLQAIRQGEDAEPIRYQHNHTRPPEAILHRMERLKEWRKQKAAGMGVESDIVLPRGHMAAIAEQGPRTPEELQAMMADLPWRYRLFGEEILTTIRPGSPTKGTADAG